MRFLPVFLGLAVIAYASAKAMTWLNLRLVLLLPTNGPGGLAGHHLQAMVLWHMAMSRLFLIPAAVVEALAAGMIAHRAVAYWREDPIALRADAVAAARSFLPLAAIALLWLVLTFLPVLPGWFRSPPHPSHLPPGLLGYVLYEYVYWHPFLTIGSVLLVGLGILWCAAIPATVIEGLGPLAALRRSITLTRGNRLRVLILWLIYAIAAALLTRGLAEFTAEAALLSTIGWMLSMIVVAVGNAAIYAEARGKFIPRSDATAPPPTAPSPRCS